MGTFTITRDAYGSFAGKRGSKRKLFAGRAARYHRPMNIFPRGLLRDSFYFFHGFRVHDVPRGNWRGLFLRETIMKGNEG